jgi:hypothetical protein
MGYDASKGSDGAINVRMREYESLIKVWVSIPRKIALLCSDFRKYSCQLIDALREIDTGEFSIFAVGWHC